MLATSALTFTGILDLIYFYKILKAFLRLKKQLKNIEKISIMQVPDLLNLFENKNNFENVFVAVGGYVKGKQNAGDKNILSAIVKNDLIEKQIKRKNIYQTIPYKQIIKKAWWLRPQNLKQVNLRIKNTLSVKNIMVKDCSQTDITGAFTQRNTLKFDYQESKSLVVIILRTIYDFMLSIFPLSMLQKRKTGQKITYYGILEDDYLVVAGNAFKDNNGDIHINKPRYLTKQLSFITKRLNKKYKIINKFFVFIVIAHLIGLYYLANWIYKKYISNLSIREQDDENEQIKPNHQCIICYSSVRSVIFKPCKHYALCYNCYYRMNNNECPVCKKQIVGIIRVIKR